MLALRRLINPSGGLRYHLRALRYRRGRWAPFREAVADWLADSWNPRERSLLLVGCSGGYCLEARSLIRFKEVVAVEPDPIARLIFRLRFGRVLAAAGTRLRFESRDFLFSMMPRRLDLARIQELLDAYPGHAVLFANVLGQLRFLDPVAARDPRTVESWLAALTGVLAGRSWASFHDRLSGPIAPRLVSRPYGMASAPASTEALARAAYAGAPARGRRAVELLDHLTGSLAAPGERVYFHWPLAPGAHHLIEGAATVSDSSLD